MKTFHLVVSTPDGTVFDGQAQDLSLRATLGELAVRAGHIPFVSAIVPGVIRITTAAGEKRYSCADGILSVDRDTTTLLCSAAKEA